MATVCWFQGALADVRRKNRAAEDLLSPEQRAALASARAWWQEGERALDFLAERARHETRIAQIQTLLADLRASRNVSPDTVAEILRRVRGVSANRALNRTLATAEFGRALRDLLYGEGSLPVRLAAFLGTQRAGAQTASQLLHVAFPDRFPLVSPATRAVLAATRAQKNAARRIAIQRYEAGEDTSRAALSLLADFVLYDAARTALGVETFADVNAILWHAREMPAATSRASGRVREEAVPYAVADAVPPEPAERDLLAYIEARVASQGFTYPPLAVRDYYLALKTKPFVILAGLSGTGKTRLTELLAEALTDNLSAQYRLLPVRPDWTDATPLLGFFNLLAGEYVSTPFLDLLTEAGRAENRERAFFVCLDEMNLARVEHYFADALSAMETRARTIPLHAGRTLRIPPNVFVTGSVNVDEATHPFSKKVLDRANTLEFTDVHFGRYAADGKGRARKEPLPDIAPADRQRLFLGARARDVREAQEKLAAIKATYPDRVLAALSSLNELLAPRGMHFGYRVRDEALMYLANAFDADGRGLLEEKPEQNLAAALDLQIVQKALPRLSGTQEALEPLLAELEAWAGEAYPRTRAKLHKMRRRAAEEGVVTFYEP